MMVDRVGDTYARYPQLDWIVACIAAVVAWVATPRGILGTFSGTGPDLSLGTSALAGMLLTAGTFAFTMAYGSRSTTMIFIRASRPREHGKNWLSVLCALATGAVLALISIPAWALEPLVAFASTAGALVLLVAVAVRLLWWLNFIMRSEVADTEISQAGRTRLPSGARPD